ncbi:MAG: hypothetical protein ACRDZ7_14500 [Acidimicrobiia bacterium]
MAADEERDDGEATDLPPDLAEVTEAIDAVMEPPLPPEWVLPADRSVPPERSRGSKPLQPRADTERTLGLEVGRLFGLNPRMLVDPDATPPPPRPRPPTEDPAGDAGGDEDGPAG